MHTAFIPVQGVQTVTCSHMSRKVRLQYRLQHRVSEGFVVAPYLWV